MLCNEFMLLLFTEPIASWNVCGSYFSTFACGHTVCKVGMRYSIAVETSMKQTWKITSVAENIFPMSLMTKLL